MSNRLPVFDVFRNSFRYMLEHYRILSLFCIFSFLGIYMLGGFNLADNLLGGAFYLLYTCSISFLSGFISTGRNYFPSRNLLTPWYASSPSACWHSPASCCWKRRFCSFSGC